MADNNSSSGSSMWAWIFGLVALVMTGLAVLFVILWRKEKAKNAPAKAGAPKPGVGGVTVNLPGVGGGAAPTGGASPSPTDVVAMNSPSTSTV